MMPEVFAGLTFGVTNRRELRQSGCSACMESRQDRRG